TWRKSFHELSEKHQELLKKTMYWTEPEFRWYARCEQFQLALVKSRYAEFKKKPGPMTYSAALERLDPLVPAPGKDGKPPADPVQFVGESGRFEPGKIAAAEKAKLPKDAILVVEQLLIWMPDDLRLYWQLGELFNAEGDTEAAKLIFKEFLRKYQ